MTFESNEIAKIEYNLWRGVMTITLTNKKTQSLKTSWEHYVEFVNEWSKVKNS